MKHWVSALLALMRQRYFTFQNQSPQHSHVIFSSARLVILENPPNPMQQRALHGFARRFLGKQCIVYYYEKINTRASSAVLRIYHESCLFFTLAGSSSSSPSAHITWFSLLWQEFICWDAQIGLGSDLRTSISFTTFNYPHPFWYLFNRLVLNMES